MDNLHNGHNIESSNEPHKNRWHELFPLYVSIAEVGKSFNTPFANGKKCLIISQIHHRSTQVINVILSTVSRREKFFTFPNNFYMNDLKILNMMI